MLHRNFHTPIDTPQFREAVYIATLFRSSHRLYRFIRCRFVFLPYVAIVFSLIHLKDTLFALNDISTDVIEADVWRYVSAREDLDANFFNTILCEGFKYV